MPIFAQQARSAHTVFLSSDTMTKANPDTPTGRDCCVVICSVPDPSTARTIATSLVTEKLAACVNILPQVTSVYEWEGKLQQDQEALLLIKTHQASFTALESRVLALHPYELPEIIMVPISGGSRAYLDWVTSCVGISL